jgi:hypothetical protein
MEWRAMKYLILITDKRSPPFPQDPAALNRAVREWVGARLVDKTFDCVYYTLPQGGMCIANADSHEALLALLRAWPSFAYSEFELVPLADAARAMDNNFERLSSNTTMKP